MLSGICFVMTGIDGVVGIDLDNCLSADGVVAPWALEVTRAANSYTEISPSGRGLRIFVLGLADGADWTNNEVGIEVYMGSTPRHLTVSGRLLPGAPTTIAPVAPGFLAGLRGSLAGHPPLRAWRKKTSRQCPMCWMRLVLLR